MTPTLFSNITVQPRTMLTAMIVGFVLIVALTAPDMVLAQDFAGTDKKVCGFFSSINGLLNMASIIVVTIAIIFSGYQIAFAHKRISEVSPVLVGGLLIGAAAQIAKMMIGGTDQCGATSGATSMVMHYLSIRYA